MLITLFIDVSHDHQMGIGAYAWSAKADQEPRRGAGAMVLPNKNHNVAGLYGLILGVDAAISEIKPPPGSKLIAQSTSRVAIAVLRGEAGGERYAGLANLMREMLIQHALEVEYRHAVDAWCERTARLVMKESRKQLIADQQQVERWTV